MRYRYINLFVFLFFLNASLLFGQQTAKTIDESYIGYLEYLPPNYNDGDQKFPVIIFLHGAGESGDGSPEELERVKAWGPPSFLNGTRDMCFSVDGKEECFIVISPQLFSSFSTWSAPYVKMVVRHVLSGPDDYKVDPDRVYLTGLSRGGHGTYLYAQSDNNEPNRLAAIDPIAAWGTAVSGCKIARRDIPVWAFHGDEDNVVSFSNGKSAFNKVKNCQNSSSTAELIFTTYEGRAHNSWIPAYNLSNSLHKPNLYEWFLSKSLADTKTVTSIGDLKNRDEPIVYPNPATEFIQLSDPKVKRQIEAITLRNLIGQLVLYTNTTDRIDISGLRSGAYIVEVIDRTGAIAQQKIIKK